MRIVTLITARGGSIEIPQKNIKPLNGIPLIAYSIKASLKSGVDETWVSTDSPEIRKVSLEYGAQVIDRPTELANDIIMPDESLIHFAENDPFDVLIFIQPTSPFVSPSIINQAIILITKKGFDSGFTANYQHWKPLWDNNVNPVDWELKSRPRRQDCPGLYLENGMLYVTKRQNLIESRLRYSGNIGIIETTTLESIDINTRDDFQFAEMIAKAKYIKNDM